MLIKIDGKYVVSVETRLLFKEKLGYIKGVLDEVSKNLLENSDSIDENYWSELGDCTDLSPEDFEYHRSIADVLKLKAEKFPQILYNSILVSVYSILETTVSDVLIFTEQQFPKRIKYKNLQKVGSEIDNTINFFDLVHLIDFNSLKSQRDSLKNYADIRNNIVHRNGSLREEKIDRKNRIISFAQSREDLLIENDHLIISDPKFISEFIAFSESFGFAFFEKLIILPQNVAI